MGVVAGDVATGAVVGTEAIGTCGATLGAAPGALLCNKRGDGRGMKIADMPGSSGGMSTGVMGPPAAGAAAIPRPTKILRGVVLTRCCIDEVL